MSPTQQTAKHRSDRSAASAPELLCGLEIDMPERLFVGEGTAFLIAGHCYAPRRRIRALEVEVDGMRTEALRSGMPRLDVLDQAAKEADIFAGDDSASLSSAFRSGFWAMPEVPSRQDPGKVSVSLIATISGGGELHAELGEVPVEPALEPPAERATAFGGDGPRIAICMATYNPPSKLLRRQLDSILAQTHQNWVCVISDDRSRPALYAELLEATASDPRFVVSRGEHRRGFYENFERALSMAPAEAEFVALADQDDSWDPDKLETLLGALGGGAQLAYSDARIVDADGGLIHDSYWVERRNNYTNLASLIVSNTVTGAASLFRREVLDDALPFPPAISTPYHDHWLALVSLARGEIAYVDRPTYSYTQHEGAVLGHAVANLGLQRAEKGSLRERVGLAATGSRLVYFYGWCQVLLLAQVLRIRCGARMSWRKRRALRRLASADRNAASMAWLLGRPVRKLWGRNETLDAERFLAKGLLWRRAISLAVAGRRLPPQRLRHDSSIPPAPVTDDLMFRQRTAPNPFELVRMFIEPLELEVSAAEPERINLLVPTFDLKHLFGGYITKFNLARRLAELGVRTRLVTVDQTRMLPRDWQSQIRRYSGLEDLFEKVEVAFARDRDAPLRINPSDRLIATTWWTAHIAHAALEELHRERFLYLVQEYEPLTFPMGSYAALARASYDFPHRALFSTELLRAYFRAHQIGVYADGATEGDRDSRSFQNAITAIEPPTAAELGERESRSLLFYARPEHHAMRNMFELGAYALNQAITDGTLGPEWQLHGMGSVDQFLDLDLAPGRSLRMLRRTGQQRYGEILRRHDIGLSLMYTPHPSLPPIEMASAGMLVVTNTFENKDADALRAISENIVPAYPSPDGINAALREAVGRLGDYEARAAAAQVSWARDWRSALNEDLMTDVRGMLDEL